MAYVPPKGRAASLPAGDAFCSGYAEGLHRYKAAILTPNPIDVRVCRLFE